MKMRTYFLLGLVGLLTVLMLLMSPALTNLSKSSAQKSRQVEQENAEFTKPRYEAYETYEASNVLELDYGDGDKQVGLSVGMEDFRPTGPMSFAINGEAIYILDEVNDRAKAFNRTGELIRSLQVEQGSSDIAVDSKDRLYVLDSRTNAIAQYEPGSYGSTRYAIEQPIDGLSADAKSGVSVKMRDSRSYSLEQSNGELNWQLYSEPYRCIKVGDRSGRVINNLTGKAFSIITEESFGSISYLGTDSDQNIYIVVEELLPGDTIQVRKEVRKYTARGKQIAEIPINIDYVAHPEKELILDEDGTVYHLLPLKDHLIVQKWSRKY